MLTLTGPAVEAIRILTTQPGLPSETGLRIAPEGGDGGSLTLSVCDGPKSGDEIIQAAGVRVFVEQDAVVMLEDKSLDAEVDEQGVIFRLGMQPR